MNELSNEIEIKTLGLSDIPLLVDAFQKVNWPKPASLFERYVHEQHHFERIVWWACKEEQCAGYVTLSWMSQYAPFAQQNIPEIMDLNVLPDFRRQGIGSALLHTAEKAARVRAKTIGIGVGLYGGPDGGYGQAQRLYVKNGYIPDGLGLTHGYKPINPGAMVCLDDELILWFTKKLKNDLLDDLR